MSRHTFIQAAVRIAGFSLVILSITSAYALSQGTKFLSVQSGSMVPAYSKGDLVIVNSVPDQSYKVGDVITFINPNNKHQSITHRLSALSSTTESRPRQYVTKGDANLVADTPIYANSIIGKVSFAIPFLGYGFDFVRQPLGLLLLIYAPAMSIIISEVRKLAKHYKDQEPYIAMGHDPNRQGKTQRSATAGRTVKVSAAAIIAATSVAAPAAHAALLSTVTVTNSSLSTLATADYPLISKVQFAGNTTGNTSTTVNVINNNPQTATSGNASGSNATSGNASNSSSTNINISVGGNSNTSAVVQKVSIYNPTDRTLSLANWTLSDNSTTRTLGSGNSIAAGATYTYSWPVANGLNKNGDRIILRNATGQIVDSLSWGSDVSQLKPAVTTTAATTSLARDSLRYDTNRASDWNAQ